MAPEIGSAERAAQPGRTAGKKTGSVPLSAALFCQEDRTIKQLIKATTLSGAFTVLNTVISFVKTKVMALLLGTEGVGFIGQLNSFFLLLSNATSLGNNVGVTRFVADFKAQGEDEKINRLIHSVRLVIGFFVLFCVILGIVFSRTLSLWILNDEKYFLPIIITLIGLPFTVLYHFYRSLFTGLLEIRTYVLTGALTALAGLLLLLPLVYFFRLNGAVWHLALFAAAGLVIAHSFYRRIRSRRLPGLSRAPVFDRAILSNILQFGAASLIATTSLYLANLIVRKIILDHLGWAQAGIYAAMLQMSNQCIQLVLESINTYCYPRLSGLQKSGEVVHELNEILRLTLTLITPLIVAFVLFKDLIIVVFLSREFLLASSLIGMQLLGDAFKAVGWSIGVSLLPMKKLKAFALIDVLWSALFVSLSMALAPRWGLKGILAAYLAGYAFHVGVNYVYAARTIAYRLWPANQVLALLSLLLIVYTTMFFRPAPFHLLLLSIGVPVWCWKAVRREEIAALCRIFKGKFSA